MWQIDYYIMKASKKIENIIENIINRNNRVLISVLEDIQKQYKYIPQDVLKEVSVQLNIPLRDVYGVVTFYKAFSLTPRGEHLISVCTGTACHVRNSAKILEEFEKKLDIKPGETTKDKKNSLETQTA